MRRALAPIVVVALIVGCGGMNLPALRALSPSQQYDLAYGTYVNVHSAATTYASKPSVSNSVKRKIVDALDVADTAASPVFAAAMLRRLHGEGADLATLARDLSLIIRALRDALPAEVSP